MINSSAGKSTYFRIVGRELPAKCAKNVKGSRKWIEQVGENVRLADGTRVTLRRPQFLDKHAVTITGEALVPPPISDLKFGDEITIDFPHPMSVEGDIAAVDLEFQPAADRIWWFGMVDSVLKPMEHGDAGVTITMWIPRMTIMIDAVNTDYDDQAGSHNWSIEGEIV